MNLAYDNWIPVVLPDGKDELVSLRRLYERADDIRDLSVNPPQRIALMRLLICITQAALDGPADADDWLRCKPRIVPESLKYLDKWQGHFELYGKTPFLQAPGLEHTGNSTLDKLDFGLSAGNNATLFDHGGSPEGRGWPDAWTALMLLTYQTFSPGGLMGVTNWNGQPTSRTSEHAPAVEGSMLHTLIRQDSLLGTLHSNLLTKAQVATLPGDGWGEPVWEVGEAGENANGDRFTHTYMGRLVPVSRAILLVPGSRSFTLANGHGYPKLPAGREPMATTMMRERRGEQQVGYLAVNLSRHPWRELGSLLAIKNDWRTSGALALEQLQMNTAETVSVWAGGMAADKGKILDVAEWSFSLPVSLLHASELLRYQSGVGKCTEGEGSLGFACKKFSEAMKQENSLASKARTHFWSALDIRYQQLVDAANDMTVALDEVWHPVVKTAMECAYAFACPHTTPRQIEAFARGRKVLKLKRFEDVSE